VISLSEDNLNTEILKGRTEKGKCGLKPGWRGKGERMKRQKAAQNCVSTQPTAAPCLSHIFAAVRSLIKNALSRKSTQTPASWRQIYEISQQGLELGSLKKTQFHFIYPAEWMSLLPSPPKTKRQNAVVTHFLQANAITEAQYRKTAKSCVLSTLSFASSHSVILNTTQSR
jgi:hypothetical protein